MMNEQLAEIAKEINATQEPEQAEPEATEVTEEVIEATSEAEGVEEPNAEEDIKSIADLAKAIEVEPEYLYGMEIGMGDGQPAVPLGELKDKYQESLRERATLETQLQEQQAFVKQAQTGQNQNQQASNELIEASGRLNEINRQYNAIDWAEYEAKDAGEAALARQKFHEAANQTQSQIQQINQYQQQQQAVSMQDAAMQLTALIPEWKDVDIKQREQKQIRDAMLGAGYSEQAVANIADPIAVSAWRELLQLRAEKAGASAAIEKVKSAPKVLKGRGRTAESSTRVNDLVTKARSSGNKYDALAAAKAVLSAR